ncbi:MAG: hypothetical protein UT66_C0015G0007 [candidate division CPR2 bacterium GW2011_GWC1_39_9]|uniref:Uncharacterized protein n=1 Tax=candidate division CPR2 bacterium GW2011_GWC2_39_10 TaxID=1618345 RepID=A0A0G0LVD9_UNCC2|nr:MAG: hypothetical protein UT18_C0005G0007 [candidate division CPR2 bacterium GW2011_GWC2_39_10]KKR34843.1 MAG: hypothetical protein UT66_C0015G0007 [candidate division CPR2 bacterium GW2011_GWC1_39_9]
MKTNRIITVALFIILIFIGIGYLLASKTERIDNGVCKLETCHGMDFECGAKPATVCTEMYMLGDKCLQHAECQIKEGSCQKVETNEFKECKLCVLNCESTNKNDPIKASACESSCE